MKRLLLLMAAVLPLAAIGQQDAVKKIVAMAQKDNRVMEHLDVFSNRFGGRPIGSDAYNNAADWAASQLRSWGYEVELEQAGAVQVGFNRGPWFGRLIGENGMALHFATPSYTSGTRGVERGKVLIEPSTKDELERMKGSLKGAWVLVEGKSTGFPIAHGQAADSMRAQAIIYNDSIAELNGEIMRRNYQNHTNEPMLKYANVPALYYREMVEAGVRGFVQSAQVPIQALYDRQVAFDSNTSFDNLPEVCDIKLDENQYAQIYKMVRERRNIELEFDIRNHFKPGPVPYCNVAATMKGTKYPDEYVMVSGHLDSYDVATGGVDCGSGISVAMEVARMLHESGAKPQRTVIIMLFAGEEFGLLGAQAWSKAHPDKVKNISCMFNRDGGPTPYTAFAAPKSLVEEYEKICKPIEKLYPDYNFKVTELKTRERPKSTGGTDASVYAMQGVPTLTPQGGDVKGYNFDYREIWHTENDLYTKSIPEYQKQAAFVTAILTLGTANLPKPLPRNEVYSDL